MESARLSICADAFSFSDFTSFSNAAFSMRSSAYAVFRSQSAWFRPHVPSDGGAMPELSIFGTHGRRCRARVAPVRIPSAVLLEERMRGRARVDVPAPGEQRRLEVSMPRRAWRRARPRTYVIFCGTVANMRLRLVGASLLGAALVGVPLRSGRVVRLVGGRLQERHDVGRARRQENHAEHHNRSGRAWCARSRRCSAAGAVVRELAAQREGSRRARRAARSGTRGGGLGGCAASGGGRAGTGRGSPRGSAPPQQRAAPTPDARCGRELRQLRRAVSHPAPRAALRR